MTCAGFLTGLRLFLRIVLFPLWFLTKWLLRGVRALVDHCQYRDPALNHFLHGGFEPVAEEGLHLALKVRGHVPADLRGEFVRNGANPKLQVDGNYHLFDGDGMLHGLRFFGQEKKPNYVNHWVRTDRLRLEAEAGKPIFPRIGQLTGPAGIFRAILSMLDIWFGFEHPHETANGVATANTSVQFHAGKLLALCESDAPYAIKVLADGALETMGLQFYQGELKHPFTAHPKLDPVTGELFFFGYDIATKPYVTYGVVDAEGHIQSSVPIDLEEPVMMHDFAITEKYAVIMVLPLMFRPQDIVGGGIPFVLDLTRKARFLIFPRYDRDLTQARWFEAESCFVFHVFNAWEERETSEGKVEQKPREKIEPSRRKEKERLQRAAERKEEEEGERETEEQGEEVVVLTGCRLTNFLFNFGYTMEGERINDTHSSPYEWRFHMKTGKVTERELGMEHGDFPKVNPNFVGRKTRIGYFAGFADNIESLGVRKIDLETAPSEFYKSTGSSGSWQQHTC